MDPPEQGDHTAPTDHHSHDRSDPPPPLRNPSPAQPPPQRSASPVSPSRHPSHQNHPSQSLLTHHHHQQQQQQQHPHHSQQLQQQRHTAPLHHHSHLNQPHHRPQHHQQQQHQRHSQQPQQHQHHPQHHHSHHQQQQHHVQHQRHDASQVFEDPHRRQFTHIHSHHQQSQQPQNAHQTHHSQHQHHHQRQTQQQQPSSSHQAPHSSQHSQHYEQQQPRSQPSDAQQERQPQHESQQQPHLLHRPSHHSGSHMDPQSRFSADHNVLLRMPQSQHGGLGGQHHSSLTRSASAIAAPSVHTASPPPTPGGPAQPGTPGPSHPSASGITASTPSAAATSQMPSSSTSKLWEHFIKGEKMQKTNKFYAHCIYCRKVNRDSSTRGERRMMSAHLSTCAEAPEDARAEALAISKELKIRRSITGLGKKARAAAATAAAAVGSSTGASSVGGVGKRPRRSAPNLHVAQLGSAASAAAVAAAAGGQTDPIVAAVAAAAVSPSSHRQGAQGSGPSQAPQGTGSEAGPSEVEPQAASQAAAPQTAAPPPPPPPDPGAGPPYFDSTLATPMALATDMVRTGTMTTSDNVRLYFEDCGTGHPLVLIHGLSASCKYFDANFRDLSARFRVIRFDLRGHGDSDKPQFGFHVHRLAADLHDLLEHFSFERVALLGCSLGCAVIWAFVELYGVSQISAAMFVDQSPYQMASPDGMWRLGSKTVFSEGSLAHVSAELIRNPKAFHEESVRAGFTRAPSSIEMSTFVNESLKSAVWFTAKLMANHSYMDWRSVLPLVSCPALVIAGKKSKVFPWEGVAYAAENMPHAKLIPFEEGSHWLYIEESVRFNSTVAAFLQSIVSGG